MFNKIQNVILIIFSFFLAINMIRVSYDCFQDENYFIAILFIVLAILCIAIPKILLTKPKSDKEWKA